MLNLPLVGHAQEAKDETHHRSLLVEGSQHQAAVLLGGEEKVQRNDTGVFHTPHPALQFFTLMELGGVF
jgi:hypothetical protein